MLSLMKQPQQISMEKLAVGLKVNNPSCSQYGLIFLEEGQLVKGSVQHGLHQQGTGAYLLFSSAESKKKYWDRFDYYTAALNAVLQTADND